MRITWVLATDEKIPSGLQSTPKVPPSFDGRISWFAYEEAIYDWFDITTLVVERQAPSLKNRLTRMVYKPLLDRELLWDPAHGVAYVQRILRPPFVKGKQAVFMWRFYQLLRCYRGSQYILSWIGRHAVIRKRVHESWMDVADPVPLTDPEFNA